MADYSNPFNLQATSDCWPGMSKLTEECGELVQVTGKVLGTNGYPMHWDGTNLRYRYMEEIADIKAAIAFIERVDDNIDRTFIETRAREKLLIFYDWRGDMPPLPKG